LASFELFGLSVKSLRALIELLLASRRDKESIRIQIEHLEAFGWRMLAPEEFIIASVRKL
jgi:hypothetical protein